MRHRLASLLMLTALGACANPFGEHTRQYSIFFQPYSSELDGHARSAIADAASFAHDHPLQPIILAGYAAPPDPSKDVDGLSAQRAEVVKQALIAGGISPIRISVEANGITDPDGKPSLAVRRSTSHFDIRGLAVGISERRASGKAPVRAGLAAASQTPGSAADPPKTRRSDSS